MTRSLERLLALAVIVLQPVLLEAQQGERSARWGVIASITPRWTAAARLGDYVGANRYDISGAELSLGVIRGRDYAGDWGVAFVWKGVSEGSASSFPLGRFCARSCFDEQATIVAKNVSMVGVEAHRFFKVATIGRRLHIGVNAAGGVLRARGRSERTERYTGYELDASTGSAVPIQKAVKSQVGGGQIFTMASGVAYVPCAKLELGVGFALTRSVKTRVSGGLAFPGYQVASVKLIYLFGRPGPESIFR